MRAGGAGAAFCSPFPAPVIGFSPTQCHLSVSLSASPLPGEGSSGFFFSASPVLPSFFSLSLSSSVTLGLPGPFLTSKS